MVVKCIDSGYWLEYLTKNGIYHVEKSYINANKIKMYKLKNIKQPFRAERFELVKT